MAPMKMLNHNNSSSNYGEGVARQANVLASCYIVNTAGLLKGLHYCTTGAAGAECPPLAAITSSNELALIHKSKRHSPGANSSSSPRSRRGGATLRIREECERFFCETMRAVFLGERDAATHGSRLTGVHQVAAASNGAAAFYDNGNGQLGTPPDECPPHMLAMGAGVGGRGPATDSITAWLEVWDYAGGASFRAFLAGAAGEESLFAFFDADVVTSDLKQALVALIELADSALACSQLVICLDRSIDDAEARTLKKGLQWAGFTPTTLDYWAHGLDVTSKRWLFMGMEI